MIISTMRIMILRMRMMLMMIMVILFEIDARLDSFRKFDAAGKDLVENGHCRDLGRRFPC